jgi:hypothetical protein
LTSAARVRTLASEEEMADDKVGARKPRAMSLKHFQFNFKVSLGAQIAARGGAPAFASRRTRWDRNIARFWSDLKEKHVTLWIAAGEGRVDDEGREVRMALMDASGRDEMALRVHKQELFRDRADFDEAQRTNFDRAWRRTLARLDFAALEAEAAAYTRYFPMEANLPTDPETGRYIWLGRRWETVRAPTREDVLAQYPLFEGDERLP